MTVGGRTLSEPNYRVNAGDDIAFTVPQLQESTPQPEAIPLNVVFEDADLIVIDKPAGLVVHPAAGNWTGTPTVISWMSASSAYPFCRSDCFWNASSLERGSDRFHSLYLGRLHLMSVQDLLDDAALVQIQIGRIEFLEDRLVVMFLRESDVILQTSAGSGVSCLALQA